MKLLLLFLVLTSSFAGEPVFNEHSYYNCENGDDKSCYYLMSSLALEDDFKVIDQLMKKECIESERKYVCAYYSAVLRSAGKLDRAEKAVKSLCHTQGEFCDYLGLVYQERYFKSGRKDIQAYKNSIKSFKKTCRSDHQTYGCAMYKVMVSSI